MEEKPITRDDHGPPANEETLKDVYERNKRIDAKDVTCVLSKPSLKLYFDTVVGEGRLDREGRRELGNKYYLHPKTYRKIAPPTLEGTKLHTLDGKEYGTLSEKAHRAHIELKNVVKLLLRQYEV